MKRLRRFDEPRSVAQGTGSYSAGYGGAAAGGGQQQQQGYGGGAAAAGGQQGYGAYSSAVTPQQPAYGGQQARLRLLGRHSALSR